MHASRRMEQSAKLPRTEMKWLPQWQVGKQFFEEKQRTMANSWRAGTNPTRGTSQWGTCLPGPPLPPPPAAAAAAATAPSMSVWLYNGFLPAVQDCVLACMCVAKKISRARSALRAAPQPPAIRGETPAPAPARVRTYHPFLVLHVRVVCWSLSTGTALPLARNAIYLPSACFAGP